MSGSRPTCEKAPSAKSTAIGLCLLIALLAAMCAGCSTRPSAPPTPGLQANLRQDCPPIPPPPAPLIDPERAIWENTMIALYGDCAGRHHRTVGAWPKPAD